MLDSERNSRETNNNNEATGHAAGAAPAPTVFNGPAEPAVPAVPAALFQPPQVLFQPPAPVGPSVGDRDSGDRESGGRPESDADSGRTNRRSRSTRPQADDGADEQAGADAEGGRTSRRTRTRGRNTRVRDAAPDDDLSSVESAGAIAEADDADGDTAVAGAAVGADEAEESGTSRRRRRRNTRTRGRAEAAADDDVDGQGSGDDSESDDSAAEADGEGEGAGSDGGASGRRRRRKRRRGSADGDVLSPDDPPDTVVHVREAYNPVDDVRAIKGSTRLEAKKQRRREGRESGRRRPPVITESEFLARRESVERTMVVRQRGDRTQMAVLEDGVLVEHYVNRTTHASYVGNVYLGKVQNVLPSMEAAFVDIGKGRNAVLYAGEVNFDASGLEGQPKRIESALKPGQSVIVQVTKDPVGHKGARLTSQVSLPGRYLVYVPGASMTGISRKLPDTERTRLKQILKKVTPENAGVIVRTAAEGAAESELDRDITRLAAQWESIEKKAKTATAPALLYGEPDLTIRVVRDVFNEDFSRLIVSGDDGWEIIDEYVRYVAPHLADRISRWDTPENEDADEDVFAAYRIDEQLAKALERKVWLPSGGSLVIDRTEAMTVVDVNTGKFTGQGGNLEETVTRNNLEAAEEIVRQLRLRDVGGIVVIDFIDMVLESNRELVLRRLLECLARDRTKHQVAEVTSLGLVQMTRKRVGAGLLEAFSQPCECCNGRGVIVALDAPAEPAHRASAGTAHRPVPVPPAQAPGSGNGNGNGRGQGNGSGNARAGYQNGRRNRRDDDRNDRDTYQDPAQDSASLADTPADAPQADTNQAGTAQAGTNQTGTAQAGTAQADAVGSVTSGAGTGTETDSNGARRTRRSTSAGTAFATAVLVEDSPALVPVVTTVPPVTDPSPSGFRPAATGDPVAAEPTDPSAPPVRRTRAGSAVARVTVVTDPEPPATPDAAPTPEPEPTAADTATDGSAPVVDTAALPTETAPPTPEAAAPATEVPVSTEMAAPATGVPVSTEWAAQATEPVIATEPEPAREPEPAAPSLGEPTIVSASVFEAHQAPSPAETTPAEAALTTETAPTADAPTDTDAAEAEQPAPAEPAPAEEAPVSSSLSTWKAAAPEELPADEASLADTAQAAVATTPADQEAPDQETPEAPKAEAEGEPLRDVASQAEPASWPVLEEPAAEASSVGEASVEPARAEGEGEPLRDVASQAEPASWPVLEEPAAEPSSVGEASVEPVRAEAEGEPLLGVTSQTETQTETVPETAPAAPAFEAAPADQGNVEAPAPDAEGEATPEQGTDANAEGDTLPWS